MKLEIIILGDDNDGDIQTSLIRTSHEKLDTVVYKENTFADLKHPAFTLREMYRTLLKVVKENPSQNWMRYGENSCDFEIQNNYVPTLRLFMKHLNFEEIPETIEWSWDEEETHPDFLYLNEILDIPSCHTIESIRLIEVKELEF